jgi:hypothetical protein
MTRALDDLRKAEIMGEARAAICPDCGGKGKRRVPNDRERGIPKLDIAPAFMAVCPTCCGTGKRY